MKIEMLIKDYKHHNMQSKFGVFLNKLRKMIQLFYQLNLDNPNGLPQEQLKESMNIETYQKLLKVQDELNG